MYGVVEDIKVETLGSRLFQFLDQRTGFEIQIESEIDPGNPDPALVQQMKSFFTEVGFYDSDNNKGSNLRQKQLPYRRQLQAQQRDTDLQLLFDFILTEIPYYRNHPDYKIDFQSMNDLGQLPIFSKSDIRRNFDALLTVNDDVALKLKDYRYRMAQTSGTTGERLQVISDMTLSRVPPDYEKLWELSITDELPKTAVLTTPTCSGAECHLGKTSMADRTREDSLLFLNSTTDLFNVSDSEVVNVFEELNEFKPHFILCNPFYLHWYARRGKLLNLSFPKIDLIWSSYQYLSAIQKREIEAFFNAPIYNSYTATELSGCGLSSECRFGHWHVREDHSLVEIEELPGRDDVGNILVTNHASRLMPLLRYRIGDLAKLTDVDCHCELSDWQTIEYHGRSKDRIYIEDAWISTREFDEVIAKQTEIDFYMCRQSADQTVSIYVITKPATQLDTDELHARIQNSFSFKHLEIHQVETLKPEASLKFRLTGSDIEASNA